MQGLVKGIWTGFLSITGVGRFLALWDKQPWLCVFLLIAIALSVVWMVRLLPGATASISKTIGGFAIGFLKIAIAFGIAMALANMVVGMALGLIRGALGSIPLIGTFLSNLAGVVIQAFLSFVMALAIGYYILKNIHSVFTKAEGILTGAMGEWKADNGGGLQGVKWSYVIATTLIFAVMICHPNWNAKAYFVGAILTSLAGIVSLFVTTKRGKSLIERGVGKVLHKPRESDGAWKCPNHSAEGKNPMPILKKNGEPERTASGRIKGAQGTCPGPQGTNPETGEAYDGWNPKEATECLSLICDYPNPFWQVCTECKYAGKDKKGFPRKPDEPVRCPQCRHIHPALPKWTKFHTPDKDKSNPKAAKKGKKASPAAPAAPAPTAPVAGSKFCTECGKAYDPAKGRKVCGGCGKPLAPAGFVPAPPVAPAAPPAPPPVTPPVTPAPPPSVTPPFAPPPPPPDASPPSVIPDKWRRTF